MHIKTQGKQKGRIIEPRVWSTQTWERATPEEQGVDSTKLLEMIEYYEKKHSENEDIIIDSISIVRNGYLIADMYFNPLFQKDSKHIIHSCTKSIMSILIGIAIDKGYIKDVTVPVLDILIDKRPERFGDTLKSLSLEDLLTMRTGLRSEDSYLYQWRGLFKMMDSDDWTKYILNLPFEALPGQRFDYSNMSSFLLSAIITKSTGMDTLSFANKYLFEPLGIKDVKWERSPQGIYIGWARLWLKPHDMAKIGLLYLHKGKWDNKQIVSRKWVEASTKAHSFPKKYRYFYKEDGKINFVASGGIWLFTNLFRPFSEGYGYQWWLDKSGVYAAIGVSGQYIIVVPKENLVVVVTSKLSGRDVFLPIHMLKKFILPSIISREPLTPNKRVQNKLARVSEPPRLIEMPQLVQELPELAKEISGNIYSLKDNPWKYDDFQLVFDPDQAEASFSYSVKDKLFHITVGLDKRYRFTLSNDMRYATKGYWKSQDTFVIDYEIMGYSNKGKWELTFMDDSITVDEGGVTGTYTYKGKLLKA